MQIRVFTTLSYVMLAAAFFFGLSALLEKAVRVFGFTIVFLTGYTPWRLLEFAAIALLFVIALELVLARLSSQNHRGGHAGRRD